jgi:hypothetical protein
VTWPCFVFDIETIPDVELGAASIGLDDLSDKQVGYVMQAKRREASGSEFLSYEQQRVVAISVALRTRDRFKVWSLGEPGAPEGRADPALLRRHREVHAGPGVLERRRLRPAGAALPRACVTASSRRATGKAGDGDQAFASTTISIAITRATSI